MRRDGVIHFSIMRKYLPLYLLAIPFTTLVVVSAYKDPNKLIAWPDSVVALAVICTLFVIAWQSVETHASVEDNRKSSELELRAYLAVLIGEGTYQERRSVDKGGDLKFECRPLIVNTGQTPARKIRFQARSAILPFPIPPETQLPETTDDSIGDSILGAQQNASMFSVLDDFVTDSEAEDIKKGVGDKGLYVWGNVTYEDIFGDKHFTRFCQRMYWTADGKARGHYMPGRNDAD
jgi:hypothetical protein